MKGIVPFQHFKLSEMVFTGKTFPVQLRQWVTIPALPGGNQCYIGQTRSVSESRRAN